MSAWADSELLVELLDRQFAFLQELMGTDQIVRLRRVLTFIEGEPVLAALLEDARVEADDVRKNLEVRSAKIRESLLSLWVTHVDEIRRRLKDGTDQASHAYGDLDTYDQRLTAPPMITGVDLILSSANRSIGSPIEIEAR
jgi:hypothetical protein